MKIVVFGLSISSAWGNGHATLLRGLFRSLHAKGHQVHFFERDVPYYAAHRDAASLPYAHLHLYSDWESIAAAAHAELAGADVGIVTSYCPDGRVASDAVLAANLGYRIFYEMDTPVTFSRLARGESVDYLPADGLSDFDLVLSYTGGRALNELQTKLGARCVAPLYGWVDPDQYFKVPAAPKFQADLSYLGTYSGDRQAHLDQFLLAPAAACPEKSFVIGGAMYPDAHRWPANVRHFEHVPPPDHCEFYCSAPLTLNITRADMASMGYCPSGRLFEAAACGTAVLSDWWEGLDTFFEPGAEILNARNTHDALKALSGGRDMLNQMAARARERTLDCHTAAIRADRLLSLIEHPVNEAKIAHESVLAGKV